MDWSALAALAQKATRTVFAEMGTYAPPGGSASECRGEFDARAEQIQVVDGVAVQTVGPQWSVLLADLPGDAAEIGASVTVRGVLYRVTEAEPDGHGVVRLRLQRP